MIRIDFTCEKCNVQYDEAFQISEAIIEIIGNLILLKYKCARCGFEHKKPLNISNATDIKIGVVNIECSEK